MKLLKKVMLVSLGLTLSACTSPKKEQIKEEVKEKEMLKGTVVHLSNPVVSKVLKTTHDVYIYLPPSYKLEASKTYPVIYAHDGQNLFTEATNGSPSRWKLSQTLDQLITDEAIQEVIVVGITNNNERIDEYTPIYNEYYKAGGKGDLYLKYIKDELKTYIDQNYRTNPNDTALMGSSLGGLISLYGAYEYPEVFNKSIAMSPSIWWHDGTKMEDIERENNRYILNHFTKKTTSKLWIDIGTTEEMDDRDQDGLNDALDDARDFSLNLLKLGYTFESDFMYYEAPRASHNEQSWAHRLSYPLIYLYGINDFTKTKLSLEGNESVYVGKSIYPIVQLEYKNGLKASPFWIPFESKDSTILEYSENGKFTAKTIGKTTISTTIDKLTTDKEIEVIQK